MFFSARKSQRSGGVRILGSVRDLLLTTTIKNLFSDTGMLAAFGGAARELLFTLGNLAKSCRHHTDATTRENQPERFPVRIDRPQHLLLRKVVGKAVRDR